MDGDSRIGRVAPAHSAALATGDTAPDRVPELRFSTADIPARLQFDAWRERLSAWVEVLPVGEPERGFRVEQRTWQLGPLALSWAAGEENARSRRDLARMRRDQLDHWVLTFMRCGEYRSHLGEESVVINRHKLALWGMQMPSHSERGKAEWLTIFVARDALPEIAPAFDALLGRTLDTALGDLLRAYLDALARQLPQMTAAEAPRAAEATLAVLRAAISGSAENCEGARPQFEAAVRNRAMALVRRNLGSARLDPARLCRMAGISRSGLYRIFESDGGVARAIQRERLRAIRRALADPAERRGIACIAEELGMPDPSSFSRAFRQEFGLTPREFRAEALAMGGVILPGGAVQGQSQHLGEMFRQLR